VRIDPDAIDPPRSATLLQEHGPRPPSTRRSGRPRRLAATRLGGLTGGLDLGALGGPGGPPRPRPLGPAAGRPPRCTHRRSSASSPSSAKLPGIGAPHGAAARVPHPARVPRGTAAALRRVDRRGQGADRALRDLLQTLAEGPVCRICTDGRRGHRAHLRRRGGPATSSPIERTHEFSGPLPTLLGGALSPIERRSTPTTSSSPSSTRRVHGRRGTDPRGSSSRRTRRRTGEATALAHRPTGYGRLAPAVIVTRLRERAAGRRRTSSTPTRFTLRQRRCSGRRQL